MYSVSNFKVFQDKFLALNKRQSSLMIEDAEKYAEEKKNSAKIDSDKFFKNSSILLEQEIEKLKKDSLLSIELKYKQKYHRYIKVFHKQIQKELKEYLSDSFNRYAEYFVEYICNNFEKGKIQTYKEFKCISKFEISYLEEQKIIFSSGKMILEISVDSIMKEYKEYIKKEISELIEESS